MAIVLDGSTGITTNALSATSGITTTSLNSSSGITTNNLTASTEVSSPAITTNIISANNIVGQICFFAMTTAPSGFLKANGAVISRTTFAALFAAIGTTYGAGDGSTTFNLPDLRGEFPRGFDDGRGVDSGRTFGSAQGDAIRNIIGVFTAGKPGFASGVFTRQGSQSGGGDGSQSTANRYTFDASNVVPTAAENRPRNIALLACIKF